MKKNFPYRCSTTPSEGLCQISWKNNQKLESKGRERPPKYKQPFTEVPTFIFKVSKQVFFNCANSLRKKTKMEDIKQKSMLQA